jgi:lipopolysaccharide export system protein LptA
MPVNIPRLRKWFAMAALLIVVIVAGFYLYARYRAQAGVKGIQSKLGGRVQATMENFSYSKSEKGRTLFTIRADKATQYSNNRYELNKVNIVMYGRDSKRFDQIYGDDFEYDQNTGDATARGKVNIDLEANTTALTRPDQAPPLELKDPVHLLTSGLVFNRNSGKASTKERIEFRIPEANGWAQGASYDSNTNELVLEHDVHIVASGPNASAIIGERAIITKEPRQAVLYHARIERQDSVINAAQLTVVLRDDNSVNYVLASGGVTSQTRGETSLNVASPSAIVYLQGKTNDVRSAKLEGGTTFQTSGANTMSGSANTITLAFGTRNLVNKVRAEGNVRMFEPPKPGGQAFELVANAMDFWLSNGRRIERAETSDNARVTLTPAVQNAKYSGPTVITAAKFYAGFNAQNRITSLLGTPGAKVVSYVPGQAERVTTSDRIEATFAPKGGIQSILQRGDFQYHERLPNGTDRAGWAQAAIYSPETQMLTLTGKPRVTEGGMTTTAREIRIHRSTGEANAEGEVKTTYSDLKPQPGGALLASGDPVHVTARSMSVHRASSVAHFSGDARLWQGANIIQAPVIEFDRARRAMIAQAASQNSSYVTTVLVQSGKNGKQTPATIRSGTLTYEDAQHVIHFSGRVTVRSADGTLTANSADVYLQPREGKATPGSAGRVDHIIAQGDVRLQQPTRQATGERLVYTAVDDKYVLTGGPPVFTDAEHGRVQGASLTFYNGNDRVLVEGGGSSRTITNTQVPERISR